MSNLQNLFFKVNLIDKISGPSGKMMKTFDSSVHRVQSGLVKLGTGVAGLGAASFTLDKITAPAKDMASALGEVSSLGVNQELLDKLNKTALSFSASYGESAADFVRSSYQIQSSINNLTGNELPAFTKASAILAKGTKADMTTITGYVGTMYGIFQQNANAIGKENWINMLAGQTAQAVQMFKTTGQEMSSAFTSLGANAQQAGIAMNEQIAILGTLQATMSGSEAGTKYKAFLAGIGKAQKVLGLQFTDSQDRMLPIVEILEKIRGKFGAIDTVTKADLLQKAFGRKEAVGLVKLLSQNVNGLANSIATVGEQTGIQKAIDMANAITDPWDKAGRAIEAVTILFGQKMLPLLNPLFEGITNIANKLIRWADLFPNIARFLGIATLGIIGITAAFSALSIAVGLGSSVIGGFAVMMAVITSPVTGIVLGVTALTAAVATTIYKWDEWGGVILYVGQAITDALGITGALQTLWQWLTAIYQGWELIFKLIYNNAGGILSFVGDVIVAVGKIVNILAQAMGLGPLFNWVKDLLSIILDGWKKITQLVLPDWMQSFISGLTIDHKLSNANLTNTLTPQPLPTITPPEGLKRQQSNTPPGGLMQQFSQMNNKKTDIGGVTVNNYGQPINGQQLLDEMAFASG